VKRCLLLVLLLNTFYCVFAQEYSIVKRYPFGNEWPYYEHWDINEGENPGVIYGAINSKMFYLLDASRNCTYLYSNDNRIIYTSTAR
jgi:hypothetical protein